MEAGKIVSSQSKMGRDRNKYTTAEKLKVIKYAEIHGNRATGRRTGRRIQHQRVEKKEDKT